MKRNRLIGTSVLMGAVLLLAAAAAIWWLRQPRPNEFMRGWETAQRTGCFGCHGSEGRNGANNPGSDELRVPAWDGGMLFMYVENPGEIEEWILYGKPKRLWPEGYDPRTGQAPHQAHDHESGEDHGLVEMPAYLDVLDEQQVKDLAALVRFIGKYGLASIPPEAAAGRQVARELGCVGCHRLDGLLGLSNPGSLKGYIPPWRGADFEDLVRNEEELRDWILDGEIGRLIGNPLAQFFVNRQRIQMPAYRDVLQPGQLDSLVDYIQWLSSEPSLLAE